MATLTAFLRLRTNVGKLMGTIQSGPAPPSVEQLSSALVSKVQNQESPAEIVDSVKFDFTKHRQELPHHRFTFDLMEQFFKQQNARAHDLHKNPTFWPKTTAAVVEKYRQLVCSLTVFCIMLTLSKDAQAAAWEVPANRLMEEYENRIAGFEERIKYLHELRIEDLLEEHPEWAKKIEDDFANFRFFFRLHFSFFFSQFFRWDAEAEGTPFERE